MVEYFIVKIVVLETPGSAAQQCEMKLPRPLVSIGMQYNWTRTWTAVYAIACD
jgi:hypothetical protein